GYFPASRWAGRYIRATVAQVGAKEHHDSPWRVYPAEMDVRLGYIRAEAGKFQVEADRFRDSIKRYCERTFAFRQYRPGFIIQSARLLEAVELCGEFHRVVIICADHPHGAKSEHAQSHGQKADQDFSHCFLLEMSEILQGRRQSSSAGLRSAKVE